MGAATIHFLARPHLVSWLLTLIWFHLLDSSETNPTGGRKLFWLPVHHVVVGQCPRRFSDGIFTVGNLRPAKSWNVIRSRNTGEQNVSGKRLKRSFWLATLLSAIASLVSPYGYKLHLHVYQYLSSRFLMNHINEFQSPNFHGIAQQCFLLLCLVSIAALAVKGFKLRYAELLVALFAIASGLYASRNLPTSGILITLVIAPYLARREAERSDAEPRPETRSYFQSFAIRMEAMEKRLRGHLLPGLTVLVLVWICLHAGKLGANQLMSASFSDKSFPVSAVDMLQQSHIEGPIFTPDDWGGYVIYRLYPAAKVVADDRHDLYGEQFFKDYLKLIRVEPGWGEVLKKNASAYVLVPAESPLAATLEQKPEWVIGYRDELAVLFQRK